MANKNYLIALALLSWALGEGVRVEAQPWQKLLSPVPQTHSIAAIPCGPTAPVTVLAVEDQYGASGGEVPTRLDYKMSVGSFLPAFDGANLSAGMRTIIPVGLASGPMLTLRGKIAFPTFDDSEILEGHLHKNPVNVIVLKRGDVLSHVLADKNVEPPYGSQRRIDQILQPYLSGDIITIPPASSIQLYEFGSFTPDSESPDFQDLVLKIDYKCVEEQDILLRNSIGVNNTSTNGNRPFKSSERLSTWAIVAASLDAPSDVMLTQLRAVVAQYTSGNLNWNDANFRVMIWSSLAAFQASPLQGDIATSPSIDVPSTGPTEFGITDSLPLIGVMPTWELGFDLSAHNLVIPAGTGRYIALYGEHFWESSGAGLGIMETTETGESDWWCGNTGACAPTASSSWSHHDGRVALEVHAKTFD